MNRINSKVDGVSIAHARLEVYRMAWRTHRRVRLLNSIGARALPIISNAELASSARHDWHHENAEEMRRASIAITLMRSSIIASSGISSSSRLLHR